jgi:8-amino-7-oxononanoate synthase
MSKNLSNLTGEANTLVKLLSRRALHQPDQRIYTFLVDGEKEEAHLTYRELDQQARRIGAWLQHLGAVGERALLLYPPGLEYIAAFFGCLYGGAIAVPAYPPRLNRPTPRLQAIVADAQATVALTTPAILSNIERRFEHAPELEALRWLVIDDIPAGVEVDWQEPTLTSESSAFLQYTSGSTSAPKGVMLSHSNLMHNLSLIYHGFDIDSESTGVFWLPTYHDMGLIGGILEPMYVSRPATLISPIAFLQHPARWLQAITRYKGTISGAPNFAYDLCVEKITPDQQTTLDLSSWKLAFCGAEPVRPETQDRFARTFEPFGFRREAFYPCYGLAEATLFVSGGLGPSREPVVQTVQRAALEQNQVVKASPGDKDTQTFVGCGQALLDQKVVIVHPETLTRCQPDEVGEIWVSGPSIAQGYWNRAEETRQTFQAYLADTGEGPFLRTGDLGFLQDGELFVTGRLKDLIIIRGRNHYPQDIELTVEQSHPALRPGCGAAFSIEVVDEERLVLVQEIKRNYLRRLDIDEVMTAIHQAVAENHELQPYAVVLIKTGSIPKTSSGKIQRHACRAGFLAGDLKVVGQWTQDSANRTSQAGKPVSSPGKPVSPPQESLSVETIQAWLIAQIAKQLKVEANTIDVQAPLTRYGLDSLAAVNISYELETWLGRQFPPTLVYDHPTIESLARYLVDDIAGIQPRIDPTGAADGSPAKKMTLDEIPPEFYQFELFPPYCDLRQRIEMAAAFGIENPYFKVHERVTNDTTVINGRELINYSSYNYLGMSGDPVVAQATKEAIDRYGTSVSASRLASGEKPLHRELEREIADLVGVEDCIVYVGGHATNVTTIGHLFGQNDLIMHDALIHNSIAQGCVMSGARRFLFPHNEWQALDEILNNLRCRYERVLIVIEGVYSMDGDIPDLPRFIEIKKHHKAFLMMDEAHSMGVLGKHGRGIGEYFGIDPNEVDLWMGTLSKSFASCGGYIAGGKALVEYLKYTAPGFVYSVGMSPQNTAAALAALRRLKAEPERVARLHERSRLFLELARERGLDTGQSKDSPVVPIIVGDSLPCMQLSQALFERGINVQPMVYPAVENNAARLRFFITCTHTEEQIRFTVEAVTEELAKIRSRHAVSA